MSCSHPQKRISREDLCFAFNSKKSSTEARRMTVETEIIRYRQ